MRIISGSSGGSTEAIEQEISELAAKQIELLTGDPTMLWEGRMWIVPPVQVVTDGLIMLVDGSLFTNSPATILLPDRSSYGNNAVPSGFDYTATSGSDGANGIVADGSNDLLSIAHGENFYIPDSFTIMLKIKIPNLSQTTKYISSHYRGASNHIALLFGYVAGKIELYDNINSIRTNMQVTISDTNYHTVAFTQSGGYFKCYLDGDLVNSNASAVNYSALFTNSYIFGSNTANKINATIRHYLTYNRGITADEVLQNHLVMMA